MAPTMHVAMVPQRIDLNPRETISLRRSGIIAAMPPTKMPRLARLAKPQSALPCSDQTSPRCFTSASFRTGRTATDRPESGKVSYEVQEWAKLKPEMWYIPLYKSSGSDWGRK